MHLTNLQNTHVIYLCIYLKCMNTNRVKYPNAINIETRFAIRLTVRMIMIWILVQNCLWIN